MFRWFLILSLSTLAGYASAFAEGAPQSRSDELRSRLGFFRFDEAYGDITKADRKADAFAALKHIPIGGADVYLATGGDYRLRFEHFENANFALVPGDDYRQTLHRFMLHGDLHVGNAFRAFLQVSRFEEAGKPGGPGPFDQSELDIQQGFVDLTSGPIRLRVGRQELVLGSGKLSDIREGPNQRQSFDAARLTLDHSSGGEGTGGQVDVFAAAEVLANDDAFSDSSEQGSRFWGVYGSSLADIASAAKLDLYYLGLDRKTALYATGAGQEQRHSFGARAPGAIGNFSFEYEAIYQTGSFGALDIAAWGLRTEHAYRFSDIRFTPDIRLIANATSGDKSATDGHLGTFDALFPNPAYTTDASVFRPRNIYELHPVLSFSLAQNIHLVLEANALWRMETGDAVYAVPGFALVTPAQSNARFIGTMYDAILTWRPSPFVTLQASYVHAAAGDAIKDAGGRDIDFMMVQSMFKF